ncbi:antibiotic biosynthesis monooxygenase [Phenylobacterium sp. LjRoot225]|uniref:antibiotic biosynthesis monooxygenase family protein n=1 Tax=Phenylobacterium sp. LjRoot225 TaxID=3342285 RepID=UPI003ECC2DD2
MVLERAELTIKDGMAEAFAAAMKADGTALLAGHKGCRSVQVGQGVENPNKFILLVQWDSVEAHVTAAQTPRHAEFRNVIGPFTAGGSAEHFVID